MLDTIYLLIGFSCTSLVLSYLWNVLNNKRTKLKKSNNSPTEPPKVWSPIPFIGSAIEMGQDIRGFILKHSKRLETPIFTATIAGKECHFLAHSLDTTMIYQRNKALDDNSMAIQFQRNVCGADPHELGSIYNDKEWLKMMMKNIKNHVWSQEAIAKIVPESQHILDERLNQCILEMTNNNGQQNIGLYDFCRRHIFCASVAPIVSKMMATDESALEYGQFEKKVALMFAKVPHIFLRKAISAREALIVKLGSSDLLEKGGSQLIKDRAELFAAAGFPSTILNRANMAILFAAVGNSIPSIFWTIGCIISHPDAKAAVQKEVDSFLANKRRGNSIKSHDASSLSTLEELDQLVVVHSCFQEAIRLYSAAFSPRDVVQDFIYESKDSSSSSPPSKFHFRKGSRIMSYFQVRHYDADIFPNPESFQYDRFLPDPVTGKPPVFTKNGKAVLEPIKIFGGGEHACVGRRFIGYEVRHLLASLFSKFDIQLAHGESLPKPDQALQGIGVGQPEREMYVEMRPRKTD
jgi:cholesterol 7alpha-monooxygenase